MLSVCSVWSGNVLRLTQKPRVVELISIQPRVGRLCHAPTRIIMPTTSLAPRRCDECPCGDKQTIPAQSHRIALTEPAGCDSLPIGISIFHIQRDSKKKEKESHALHSVLFLANTVSGKWRWDRVLRLARLKYLNIYLKSHIWVHPAIKASCSIKKATAVSNSGSMPPPEKI